MHKVVVGSLASVLLCAASGPVLAQSTGDWGGTWSGFYAGIYGGYAPDRSGASKVSGTLADSDGNIYDSTMSAGRIEAPFGGIAAGYNAQTGVVVLGIETDLSLGGFNKSTTVDSSVSGKRGGLPFTVTGDLDASYSLGAMASVRGRIGVEGPGSALFYLTGGLAVAERSVSTTQTIKASGNISLSNVSESSSGEELVMGPTLGVGVEAMVADHISVGAEYDYVALPDVAIPNDISAVSLANPGSFGGGIHTLKGSLKYHF